MAILVRPPAESAHWYSANGEPVHTRPTPEGTPRSTTLADARKLGLYPSVTGILGILGKKGLEKWKINQVLLAMKRTPQANKEADEVYFDRVVNEAFAQVDTASTAGTGLHHAIMCALQGRPYEAHFQMYVDLLFAFFERAQIEPRMTEQTLVNHTDGFAGTMDFAGIRGGAVPIVLDWKTRRTRPGQAITSYEAQPMQIAAYGRTYWANEWPMVIGGNIYISSTEPGRIEMVPYDYNRMKREYESFQHCCHIWRHLNGYDPRLAGSAAETIGSDIQGEKYNNVIIGTPVEGMAPLTSLIPKSGEAPAPKVKGAVPGFRGQETPSGAPGEPTPEQPATATEPKAPLSDLKTCPACQSPVEECTCTKALSKKERAALAKAAKESAAAKLRDEAAIDKAVMPTINEPAASKPAKVGKAPPTDDGPRLQEIPFGKFKGTQVHNIPVEELEKLVKFSRKNLEPHPEVMFAIKRFLDAKGSKVAKQYLASVGGVK